MDGNGARAERGISSIDRLVTDQEVTPPAGDGSGSGSFGYLRPRARYQDLAVEAPLTRRHSDLWRPRWKQGVARISPLRHNPQEEIPTGGGLTFAGGADHTMCV
jgi:hypothetical protein